LDATSSSLSALKIGPFTRNEKDSYRMRSLSLIQIHLKKLLRNWVTHVSLKH